MVSVSRYEEEGTPRGVIMLGSDGIEGIEGIVGAETPGSPSAALDGKGICRIISGICTFCSMRGVARAISLSALPANGLPRQKDSGSPVMFLIQYGHDSAIRRSRPESVGLSRMTKLCTETVSTC